MREGVAKMESLYTEYPAGFTYTHEHPLPHCDAEWIRQTDVQTDRMLLHFPGGAYYMRMPRMERALVTGICQSANTQARLVQYRLAPENPFPAGHDDCVGAYRQLLELDVAPDRIVLSGISAGGGLVLGVLIVPRLLEYVARFESAEIIPTDLVPWQFEITIPRCEFRMGNFQARGRELIRFDLAGLMVDDENSFANPITMKLVNTVGGY